jgi:hypothetical protein
MGCDISRKRDRPAEMEANLKTIAATMRETAHTAAQKVAQDRLMSGYVQDAIKSTYQMAAPFTIEGSPYPGDLLEPRLLRLENPTGQQGGMFDLGPARQQTRKW